MRLPQSSSQPFSVRVISIITTIAFAVLLPMGAHAAKQQLLCGPARLRFGAVTVGQTETQLVSLTNTGQTSATVSAVSVSDAGFKVSGLKLPLALAAGESVTFSVTFTPTATGFTGGKVTVTSDASNPILDLGYVGTGVASEILTASPLSVGFGQTAVGASATRSIVLTNAQSFKTTLKAFQTTGSEFTVSGPTLPLTLGPGQSATLSVAFAPQTAGLTGGSLYISGPALNIPFTGTGTMIGQLSVSPTALNFGSVLVGDTGTQTTLLKATGGSVTISSAASSNNQFALPGVSFPVTIGAGQSMQLNVAFTPQKSGTTSASLSFSSNASDATASEPVSGTGTAPQVSLGWSASTSAVQGYNVYRGTAPGSYTKINTALDPNTTYTDTTVAGGTTYYYAATAVNSSGQESTYSSPVEIAIP